MQAFVMISKVLPTMFTEICGSFILNSAANHWVLNSTRRKQTPYNLVFLGCRVFPWQPCNIGTYVHRAPDQIRQMSSLSAWGTEEVWLHNDWQEPRPIRNEQEWEATRVYIKRVNKDSIRWHYTFGLSEDSNSLSTSLHQADIDLTFL